VLVVDIPPALVSLYQVRNTRQRTLKCPGPDLSRLVLEVVLVVLCVWKKSCFVLNGLSSNNYSCQSPIRRVVWVLRTSARSALRTWRRRNDSFIIFRSPECVRLVLTCAIHHREIFTTAGTQCVATVAPIWRAFGLRKLVMSRTRSMGSRVERNGMLDSCQRSSGYCQAVKNALTASESSSQCARTSAVESPYDKPSVGAPVACSVSLGSNVLAGGKA